MGFNYEDPNFFTKDEVDNIEGIIKQDNVLKRKSIYKMIPKKGKGLADLAQRYKQNCGKVVTYNMYKDIIDWQHWQTLTKKEKVKAMCGMLEHHSSMEIGKHWGRDKRQMHQLKYSYTKKYKEEIENEENANNEHTKKSQRNYRRRLKKEVVVDTVNPVAVNNNLMNLSGSNIRMNGDKLQNLIGELLSAFDNKFKTRLIVQVISNTNIKFGIDIDDIYTVNSFTDDVLPYILSLPRTVMFKLDYSLTEIEDTLDSL